MNNSELIKELRTLTQAGMKDCRDALEEAGWDLQKAVDIVKTKGLNIVSGREGKIAAEGVVAVVPMGTRGLTMVEVNCQTDFVANSSDFHTFANQVATSITEASLKDQPFTVDQVEEARSSLVFKTKENVVIRRWWIEEACAPGSMVASYVHPNAKIGVLLTILVSNESVLDIPLLTQLAEDLAMQVAAMNPAGISVDRLDAEVVERQRGIFETQLKELNKPATAWGKILEGKFNKWHTEVCLLEQESIVHPKTTIKQVIKNAGTSLGTEIQVVNFIRCQVGEGVASAKKLSFADEVSELSGVHQHTDNGPPGSRDCLKG